MVGYVTWSLISTHFYGRMGEWLKSTADLT